MKLPIFLFALLFAQIAAANSSASTIRVVGLFSDKALVMINGQRHLLSVGRKPVAGVKLLAANSNSAVLEVNGKTHTYQLSRDMSSGIQEPETASVQITRNNQGQYITRARINNQPMDVLVDTGANVLAINSQDAMRLGINYQSGDPVRVETASDVVSGYRVILNSVSLGNIRVNHVAATVIEGTFPDTVLLGMSFLKHVKLSEHRGVMQIEANY